MIYAVYKDDGPQGVCPQDCKTTSCWTELYIFETYQQFREIENKTFKCKHRKNPHFIEIFSDNELDYMSKVKLYRNGRMVLLN